MPKVTVGEIAVNYAVAGAGLPLLLVHGFPLHHGMWREQLAGLADSARLLAPDLRGFGDSGPAANGRAAPERITMEEYADELVAFLDAVGVREPVVLCGLSMGGYIAWPFVRKYADRVRGLVLCDTRAVADPPEVAAGRLKAADEVLQRGTDVWAATMMPRLFAKRTRETQPALVDEVRRMFAAASRSGSAAAARGMAVRPDVREQLPNISVPTLVVVGEDDQISTSQEMSGIAARIPRATFVEIPQAGHLAPLENPAAFNAALKDWLRSV